MTPCGPRYIGRPRARCMLFASFDFVLFFVPVLLAYWLLAKRPVLRWAMLLGASYFFYCASAKPPIPMPHLRNSCRRLSSRSSGRGPWK